MSGLSVVLPCDPVPSVVVELVVSVVLVSVVVLTGCVAEFFTAR